MVLAREICGGGGAGGRGLHRPPSVKRSRLDSPGNINVCVRAQSREKSASASLRGEVKTELGASSAEAAGGLSSSARQNDGLGDTKQGFCHWWGVS